MFGDLIVTSIKKGAEQLLGPFGIKIAYWAGLAYWKKKYPMVV
jgi:hypothetical protein